MKQTLEDEKERSGEEKQLKQNSTKREEEEEEWRRREEGSNEKALEMKRLAIRLKKETTDSIALNLSLMCRCHYARSRTRCEFDLSPKSPMKGRI